MIPEVYCTVHSRHIACTIRGTIRVKVFRFRYNLCIAYHASKSRCENVLRHTHHATTPHTPLTHRSHTMSDPSGGGGTTSGGGGSGRAAGQLQMAAFLDGGAAAATAPEPEQQQQRYANPEASKLKFPADVPAAVKSAVVSYRPPAGHQISKISPIHRSISMYYGVRLEIGDGPHTQPGRKQKWACLADHDCRAKPNNLLAISAGGTSGGTTHLQSKHGIGSKVSAKTRKRYVQLWCLLLWQCCVSLPVYVR